MKIYSYIFILFSSLTASIIHIPADQPNIQSGIFWANPGDTVLVASGTYTGVGNVDINFYGKSVHLLSESGWENTIIDLEYENRGFYFSSGEDTTSIIEGFKIKEGKVDQYEGNIPEDYGYGGAVYIGNTAFPKFVNCRFEYNDAYQKGDAISIRNGGNALFENCYFYYNYRTDGSRQGGAVEIFNSSSLFRGTTFDRNGDYSDYDGGALYIYSDEIENENSVEIVDCEFINNGTPSGSSFGGAIYLHRTELLIRDSYFYDNDVNSNGGAIYIDSSNPKVFIQNCIFDYNGRSANYGGAIYKENYGDTLFINQSTFTRNGWSTTYGGAIYIDRSLAKINNSEITRNVASNGSGIEYRGNWSDNYLEINFSTISHNYTNASNNTTTSLYLRYNETNAVINNSIISYGYFDGANSDNLELNNTYTDAHNYKLYLDHHYEVGNFKLAAHSPAIGYGIIDDRFPYDRDGNPRVNPDGSNPDVGCYESTRSEAELSTTTIFVSPDGDDDNGSGELDNPYKTVNMGVRASHYDYSDTVSLAPGTYNENDLIRLRGRKVYIQSQEGSDETILIFPETRSFTNESFSFTNNYPNGLYTNTLEGIDIRINSTTDYGIYMYDSPIHLIDVVIEDEIYSEKTSFNIDGLKSYTSEGFSSALIKLYNQSDNEDFNYNFNNLDIIANGGDIIYMYNNYNSNWRDMNVNITNSSLRAGSSGSLDVFQYGCCQSNAKEDRIFIENSFIEGDIDHRGLKEFTAYHTVFKNTRFDISWDYSSNSTDFDMQFCTVENGYFYSDADGLVKNTIFYPNIDYDNYQSQSNLEFQYSCNIPDNAPNIGVYNITADPLFLDSNNENYTLFPSSPCIDTGHPDNDGDGSNWDIDPDDQDSDGSRFDMGKFDYNHFGEYQSSILLINDVPDDQGGLLRINWTPSPNDVLNGNIIHYGIWRINEDDLDGIGLLPAIQDSQYTFVVSTINDSVPDNPNWETFLITAHTPDPSLYYTSEPDSGYSVDNIAPSTPDGFLLSSEYNTVTLTWSPNLEEDFEYYTIYRNDEPIAYTLELSFQEINYGELTYYMTATDNHGNESNHTEPIFIFLNLPGDVNFDEDLNVFDVILMVEYILDAEEFTEEQLLLADYNQDGNLDILDIILWINEILGLNRIEYPEASDAELIKKSNGLFHNANGLVGYKISLSHNEDFSIDITNDALIAEFNTIDNITKMVIIQPETNLLFSTNSIYTITDFSAVSFSGYINVNLVEIPMEFSIHAAYPNPFNPKTKIKFSVPEYSTITSKIYDLNGREVSRVIDKKPFESGSYEVIWDGSGLSSGIYLHSISDGYKTFTQKLTLLK